MVVVGVVKIGFLLPSVVFHLTPLKKFWVVVLILNFGLLLLDTKVGRNGFGVDKVDTRTFGAKPFEPNEDPGNRFSEANLLYVSAAGGCHLGLHVVTAGVVVGGSRLVVVEVVFDVVGLTLYIGNFRVGNMYALSKTG